MIIWIIWGRPGWTIGVIPHVAGIGSSPFYHYRQANEEVIYERLPDDWKAENSNIDNLTVDDTKVTSTSQIKLTR